MALPDSIQAAADRADEIEKQFAAGVAPAEEAPQASPAETEEAAEPQVAAQPEESSDEKWEAKYKTLQGMYNADRARDKAAAEETQKQIEAYRKQIEELRSSIAKKDSEETYITDEDSEVFGEDLVGLARRAAKQEASRYSIEAAQMRNELDRLRSELDAVHGATEQNRMDTYLRGLSDRVPGWEQQNTDQGFLNWLNENDPFSGGPRKLALDAAYNGLDVNRTAAIFQAYRDATQPKAAPAARTSTKAEDALRKQVTPSSKAAAPVTDNGNSSRIFSMDEIQAYYENARRHMYTAEEESRLEREIDLAVAEGRVR